MVVVRLSLTFLSQTLNIHLYSQNIVKSKDIQKIIFSKYEKGEGPTKIFRDLNGAVGLRTVKRWCKIIRDTGSIELLSPPGGSRIFRTQGAIEKVKNRYQLGN